MRSNVIWSVVLLAFGGCTGAVSALDETSSTGDGGSGGQNESPGDTDPGSSQPGSQSKFVCNTMARQPAATLRRLTMLQYRNTLQDLVGWAVGDATTANMVMTGLVPTLKQLPDDQREKVLQEPHGAYRRMDQSLQQGHVAGFYVVGTALADALTTPALFGKVVGACATDNNAANDGECLRKFLGNFGARVFRRQLTADDTNLYVQIYGADAKPTPLAYANLIATLLNAPQFLYFVEHGEDAVASQKGMYRLSAFELASRLSYQYWDTMPDAELWQKASDGTLLQADVLAKQVNRLVGDERTKLTMKGFFNDWLKVDDVPLIGASNQDPIYQTFAGADKPSPELRQQMIDEVLAMTSYYTWTKPGGTSTLLNSDLSFAKGKELAKIYGVPAWDGAAAPPQMSERPGLLTRAMFLSTATANTRPIMKGVFIRKSMLCNEIPPPPPAAASARVDLRPDMTTRQVVEALTEQEGSVCASCHKSLINPLGYATRGYDALGRLRTAQKLFDEGGKEIGTKPVDTKSIPRIDSDDQAPSSGASDLMGLLVKSGQVDQCAVRQYLRFTEARWDDPDQDGCMLEDMRRRLASTGDLREMLKAPALHSEFQQRAFE